MSILLRRTQKQIGKIKIYFPFLRGVRRLNGRQIISGIIYVIKAEISWSDTQK